MGVAASLQIAIRTYSATLTGAPPPSSEMGSGTEPTVSVDFEVYGKVQGVYFTKYCKEICEQFGIAGWVKNSKRGTIVGKIQGLRSDVEQVILWLTNTGSPGSQIDHCALTNWENLTKTDFKGFSIRF